MKRAGLALGLVAHLATPPVLAQEPLAVPAVQAIPDRAPRLHIVVRATPGLPDRAIRFLARVGVASTIDAMPGSDALALLEQKCGNRGAALAGAMRGMNGVTHDRVPDTGQLRLPACARFEERVVLAVEQDIQLAVLLRRATGFEGEATQNAFWAANPALRSGPDPNHIRAGTQVVLPHRSSWTAIELRADAGMTAAQALVNLRQLTTVSRSGKGDAGVTARTSLAGAIMRPVPQAALLDGETPCTAPGTSAPFDSTALLEALGRNNALAATRRLGPVDTGIAILDSNFAEPPAPPFATARLRTSGAPGNDLYYGVNAAAQAGAPLALATIDPVDHGTMVATLALGGPAFLAADQDRAARLQLRLSSIVEPIAAEAGPNGIPTRVLESAVDYGLRDALENNAYIVNMSFEFARKTQIIGETVAKNPRLLVVTAAGNYAENLATVSKWPASFGGYSGDLASRVITVGASDAAPLAAFSARGRNQVDIVAPGCAVATLGFDRAPRAGTGTSFAAPLVSFTAALVRQLGVQSAQEIKQRILVSTDVRAELVGQVWSAGILNPVKAVELFHDRVELDGATAPQLGRIDWDPGAQWRCSDGGVIEHSPAILKVARIGPAGSKSWLVIWRNANDTLDKCMVDLSHSTLEMVDPDGKPLPTLLTSQIVDLITGRP